MDATSFIGPGKLKRSTSFSTVNSSLSLNKLSCNSSNRITHRQTNLITQLLENHKLLSDHKLLGTDDRPEWECKMAKMEDGSSFCHDHYLTVKLEKDEINDGNVIIMNFLPNGDCPQEEMKQANKLYDTISLQMNIEFLRNELPNSLHRSEKSITEVYKLVEKLQKGGFGAVLHGIHREKLNDVAVKVITRSTLVSKKMDETEVYKEICIMASLQDHPNIVSIQDFFEDAKAFYIVMDLMEGGDLFKRLKRLKSYSEKDARDLCRNILKGIEHCHDCKVCHRDLKPANLLLRTPDATDDNVAIADFGLAAYVYSPQSLTKRCGTVGFCAPEMLRGLPYDEKVDMWSVGVIIYMLLGGQAPFRGEHWLKHVVRGQFSYPEKYWHDVSDEAKDLINKLLQPDPSKRYTCKQAISSSWFTEDPQALSDVSLMPSVEILENIDYYMAKLKLNSAVHSIIFQDRLRNSLIQGSNTLYKLSENEINSEISSEPVIDITEPLDPHPNPPPDLPSIPKGCKVSCIIQ